MNLFQRGQPSQVGLPDISPKCEVGELAAALEVNQAGVIEFSQVMGYRRGG